MAQLTQKYKEAAGRPFDLRQDLDDEALSAMEYGLEIYPWEYTHTIVRPAETRAINVVSPVRWVFAYRSDYTPSQVRALLAGKGERRGAALRHFIVNALALQIVLARTAGLTQLLQDLRYTVSAAEDPVLGKLPLLTISSALPSFRPGDELILTASRYSGVPSFIELVDEDAARSLDDPFRSELEALLM
jgi:hypothetical protein